AYGIIAVSTKWRPLTDHPDEVAFSPNGVTFQDGNRRPTFDLILKEKPRLAFASGSMPKAK
ncbi:hypothetical protein ABTM85_20575, partial [Acinetobacter baumannii]